MLSLMRAPFCCQPRAAAILRHAPDCPPRFDFHAAITRVVYLHSIYFIF